MTDTSADLNEDYKASAEGKSRDKLKENKGRSGKIREFSGAAGILKPRGCTWKPC